MKQRKVYSFIFVLLCLSPSWAAEAPKENPDQEDDAQISSGEQEQLPGAGSTANPEEDSESEAEDQQQGSSRFIPTEQISQDLGVSFPIDI